MVVLGVWEVGRSVLAGVLRGLDGEALRSALKDEVPKRGAKAGREIGRY